jgi:gliding motility-associated-like protein
MKYFLSFIVLLVLSIKVDGQIVAYHDSINCATTSTTLHAIVTGDIPTSSGITGDDNYSGIIPIGFTFNFYGNPYTQLIIGSNGNLCFNTGLAGSYDPWPISAALLGNSSVYNSICGPWCDIYIPSGGTITYSTDGAAPNRKFVVTYCATHMFSCTTEWVTTQIILYETSDITEVHLGHRTICGTGWNNQRAIIGVQNSTGTSATAAPSRDWMPVWVAVDEAWRFSPIGGPSYSVASIPYAPIPYASSAVYWYDSSTGAYLGTGPTLPVAPIVGTTYKAVALGCADSTFAFVHVIAMPGLVALGAQVHITSTSSTNPTVCGKCDGSISLIGVNPGVLDTIFYSFNGVPQPNLLDSAGSDSTIRLRNLCAGVYDYIYVKQGNCPSNQVGPITLGAPPLHIDVNYILQFGCTADNVQFYNLSTPVGADYISVWDFGDGSPISNTPAPAHTYNTQGIYTVHYTDSTTYGCHIDTTFSINTLHPIDAHFMPNANAVCLGMPIHFDGTTVSTNEPKFSWNFGDGSNPVTDTTSVDYTYLSAGRFTTTFTVKDAIGCSATATDTFEVISIDIHTGVHDTSVCLVDSMTMRSFVDVMPKYVGYTYNWSLPDYIGSTNTSDTRFFGVGSFVYTVTATTPPLVLNPLGCIATDTEKVNSYPPVTLTNLTASNQFIPFGGSIQLNATGAVYYMWTPNNGTLSNNNVNNPIATPVDSVTVYTVYGRNFYGCIDSAQIVVNLDYTMGQEMPSGFTPNGDGLNDVFRITKLKYQRLVDFRIYNRWGLEVFQTSNPEIGWDGTYHGTPQDLGVYSYQIIVAMPGGDNKTFKGTVTLIR